MKTKIVIPVTLAAIISTALILQSSVSAQSTESNTSGGASNINKDAFQLLPRESRELFIRQCKTLEELHNKGDYVRAAETGAYAEAVFSEYADFQILYGSSLVHIREFEKAREQFRKAEVLMLDNFSVVFNIAETDFVTKNWKAAKAGFTKCLGLAESHINQNKNQIIHLLELKLLISEFYIGETTKATEIAGRHNNDDSSPYSIFAESSLHFLNNRPEEGRAAIARAEAKFDEAALSPWIDTLMELDFITPRIIPRPWMTGVVYDPGSTYSVNSWWLSKPGASNPNPPWWTNGGSQQHKNCLAFTYFRHHELFPKFHGKNFNEQASLASLPFTNVPSDQFDRKRFYPDQIKKLSEVPQPDWKNIRLLTISPVTRRNYDFDLSRQNFNSNFHSIGFLDVSPPSPDDILPNLSGGIRCIFIVPGGAKKYAKKANDYLSGGAFSLGMTEDAAERIHKNLGADGVAISKTKCVGFNIEGGLICEIESIDLFLEIPTKPQGRYKYVGTCNASDAQFSSAGYLDERGRPLLHFFK